MGIQGAILTNLDVQSEQTIDMRMPVIKKNGKKEKKRDNYFYETCKLPTLLAAENELKDKVKWSSKIKVNKGSRFILLSFSWQYRSTL